MSLSSDIVSQFVKITNDVNKETSSETTVYGTTVNYNGRTYVKLDGSELLTPVKSTASVTEGDKVTVVIGNHTATITGNLSDPAASSKTVEKQGSKITEFEIIMAYKVTTDDLEAVNASIENLKATAARLEDATIVNAEIESLEAKFANLEYVNATDIEAITANIESIQAKFGEYEDITTENLEAVNAEIDNLTSYTAEFTYVSADVLDAMKANIKILEAEKLSVEEADIRYANIDFSNIGKAAMEYFYANSGLIHNVTINDGIITGELVGVTFKGDLIEGGTIIADKLVIKGEDGIYYKLNTSVYENVYYKVTYDSETGEYTATDETIQNGTGDLVLDTYTTEGDAVYSYVDELGETAYFIKTVVYNDERVNLEEVPRDTLNGTVITAKSITAEKVSVSDLVAFDATIGGFNITENSIYSGVKGSVDNTTQGVYLDKEGQMALGDSANYIKCYKDDDGTYRLAINADDIFIGGDNNLANLINYIRIDPENGTMTFGAGENAMELTMDHNVISFSKNGELFGWWDGINFHTGNIVINVTERAQFGNYAFVPRTDGSLSFLKVENNTGFYTITSAKTMFLYGTYPTTEDTTLVFSDISVTLEDTTLTLGGE